MADRCWKFSICMGFCLSSVCHLGCGQGPKRLQPPKIDPSGAATAALATYDKNSDDKLSSEELVACPGLQVALASYDTDGDGSINEAEIRVHLESLTKFKTALTPLQVAVQLQGQPLVGATVKFIPEAYLGDQVKMATGTTGPAGSAALTIADEDLPAAQRGYSGIHYGTFRVEITHPTKSIPAKYNVQTTLGYETRRGDPSATFDLSS